MGDLNVKDRSIIYHLVIAFIEASRKNMIALKKLGGSINLFAATSLNHFSNSMDVSSILKAAKGKGKSGILTEKKPDFKKDTGNEVLENTDFFVTDIKDGKALLNAPFKEQASPLYKAKDIVSSAYMQEAPKDTVESTGTDFNLKKQLLDSRAIILKYEMAVDLARANRAKKNIAFANNSVNTSSPITNKEETLRKALDEKAKRLEDANDTVISLNKVICG